MSVTIRSFEDKLEEGLDIKHTVEKLMRFDDDILEFWNDDESYKKFLTLATMTALVRCVLTASECLFFFNSYVVTKRTTR